MDRKEFAVEKIHSGCNCCQAVLCAFAEDDCDDCVRNAVTICESKLYEK